MIDRSLGGNAAHLTEDDLAKIDRILDVTETVMKSVAAEHRLRGTKIEQWRWDKPEVLMSWSPFQRFPSVGKNIRLYVKPQSADTFECSFESYAWYDERKNGHSFTRYWAHFPAGTFPVAHPEDTLDLHMKRFRESIERAYQHVSDAGNIRLNQAMHIASDGEAHRVSGSVVIGQDRIEHVAPSAAD